MAKPTTRAREGSAAERRPPTLGAARGPKAGTKTGPKTGAKTAPRAGPKGTPTVSPPTAHRPFAKLAKAHETAPTTKAAVPAAPDAKAEVAEAEDERLRFARMMRGVRPLSGVKAPPAEASSPRQEARSPRERAVDADAEARAKLIALVAEGVRFEVLDDGDTLEGRRLDVDPSEIRKLRQLRYTVDGTLDLHGLDAASARAKLEAFLRRRRLQGDRAVLVVHGKGSHSPRGSPVLRGEIGAWLSQGKAQRDVAAFSSVQDRTGDSGAVFVLLSR